MEKLPSLESDADEARFAFLQKDGVMDVPGAKPILSGQEPHEAMFWPKSYERSMSLYSRSPLVQRSLSSSGSDLWHNDSIDSSADYDEPLLNGEKYHALEDWEQQDAPRVLSGHGLILSRRSSFLQAILNGMNILAGVGILSMPYAVAQGGWLGLSFLVLFAAICCYTGLLLRRCLDLDSQLLGYPDVGQAAFGRIGRAMVSAMLYFELFAVAVEFLILEGDNLTELIPWGGFHFGSVRLSSQTSFIMLSALVMLPTVWLRDLRMLSYISASGVAACVLVLFAVAWVGLFETGFHYGGHLLSIQGFPIALGLYAFCYCGHAVFPNIYGSLEDKRKFSLVLVTCFVLCTLIYGGIAVLGFLMFGDNVKSQITLNLPKRSMATKIAIVATLVNPFAKYALTLTPLAAALEELLPRRFMTQDFLWRTMIRTLLAAGTVVVALTVPFFAYLMALVGSFLSTTVAIIIPCACYLKLFYGRIPGWEMVTICAFMVLGLVACASGTYSSLLKIVHGYSVY